MKETGTIIGAYDRSCSSTGRREGETSDPPETLEIPSLPFYIYRNKHTHKTVPEQPFHIYGRALSLFSTTSHRRRSGILRFSFATVNYKFVGAAFEHAQLTQIFGDFIPLRT